MARVVLGVVTGQGDLHSSGREQSWLGVPWQPVWGLALILTLSSAEISLVTRCLVLHFSSVLGSIFVFILSWDY